MATDASRETGSHFLFPSQLFVSREPMDIQTLLGSCIAVCLYDTKPKFGGMNHYMVPLWNGEGLASPKYGNIAIEMLIEKMREMGSVPANLVAKVFGGANQYEYENNIIMVGKRNIEVAESMLSKHKLLIAAKSTGGPQGRKIIFNTETGQVKMKYIVKQPQPQKN